MFGNIQLPNLPQTHNPRYKKPDGLKFRSGFVTIQSGNKPVRTASLAALIWNAAASMTHNPTSLLTGAQKSAQAFRDDAFVDAQIAMSQRPEYTMSDEDLAAAIDEAGDALETWQHDALCYYWEQFDQGSMRDMPITPPPADYAKPQVKVSGPGSV